MSKAATFRLRKGLLIKNAGSEPRGYQLQKEKLFLTILKINVTGKFS